jgi:hypothetical protein
MFNIKFFQFCDRPIAARPTASLTVIDGMRGLFASICGFLLLTGCGPAANTAATASPPLAAKPDVIVTIDGQHHACVVALSSEAQGSSVACDEVVPFVRDELRVPSGGIYDIRVTPGIDKAEMAKVEAGLQGGGYRFIGGPHPGSN